MIESAEVTNKASEILRWGCAVSEALLESPSESFRTDQTEGFIGYFLKNDCAVVMGDPVAPREDWPMLVDAFHQYCSEKKLSVIYFVVSEPFAEWAMQKYCRVKIQVGEELIFDPYHDPLEGSKSNRLRNKVHHARHLGLKVEEYQGNDPATEQALDHVVETWTKARSGPQLYLGDIKLFSDREARRWFYVQGEDGQFYSVALLKRLDGPHGWLLKNNVTLQDAPRGTSELLIISILETLRKEGCRFVTYGIIPAENLQEIQGLGSISTWIAKKSFNAAKWYFSLSNRKTFWAQFHPIVKRAYVLFTEPKLSWSEIKAMMTTLKMDF